MNLVIHGTCILPIYLLILFQSKLVWINEKRKLKIKKLLSLSITSSQSFLREGLISYLFDIVSFIYFF